MVRKNPLALLGQAFLVHCVCPDALDDLEYLVSDIKFVIELGVGSCYLHLCIKNQQDYDAISVKFMRILTNVEFHERVE